MGNNLVNIGLLVVRWVEVLSYITIFAISILLFLLLFLFLWCRIEDAMLGFKMSLRRVRRCCYKAARVVLLC
jgi:hypothetical protein